MRLLLQLLLFLSLKNFLDASKRNRGTRPHIIFIYADDLGWNDVSYNGSPQIPTPNIDALASSGIILNNYYGESLCTPSRAALLTGRYPIYTGLHHYVILAGQPAGLPLGMTTMAEYLKKIGYSTHMIGKWNLGYMKKEYTPTYRGFDTFFGYYNGGIDYFDYTYHYVANVPNPTPFFGVDLQNGTTPVKNFRGPYATHVFTEKAEDIIRLHNTSKPLFLYLAQAAVHVGNEYMPLQAPPEIVRKFSYIKNEKRRIHAAMVSALDDSVGKVVEALHKKGMLKNSIVVFASDNGGDSTGVRGGHSSNYPLRGEKMTFWEGGVHVPALIWSPLLKLREPRVSKQLMHVTDWLPTLYAAAGGNVNSLGTIDGFNMWSTLLKNGDSPRTELLHSIDPIFGMSAFRRGDMKVINGSLSPNFDGWFGATGLEDMERPKFMDEWVFQRGCTVCDILKQSGLWLVCQPDTWRVNSGSWCKGKQPVGACSCNPTKKPCLFNITADPCECFNLAGQMPEIVESMMKTIYKYQQSAVKVQNPPTDPRGNPLCTGFSYVPWMDPEYSKTPCVL